MPWLFLCAAAMGVVIALNAYWPPKKSVVLAGVGFFAGWLTIELALHHLCWQLAMTAAFIALGGLSAWPGWVALGMMLVSWSLLLGCYARARNAEAVVDRALRETLGESYGKDLPLALAERDTPSIRLSDIAFPLPIRHPEVELTRDLVYTEGPGYRIKLDVYKKRGMTGKRPTLLQIHGGAWVIGSKNQQGLPLVVHLASRGWVCINANYRLAPKATFPAPLIDLKQALKWIREHGAELGADPDFIVVSGGSAGGHLASLVALTQNDPEYQPGFEETDTSVRACVAFYGVYDFTDRYRDWPNQGLARLLERSVMKASLDQAREAYEKASPMSRVHPEAPPFFIIHGDTDSLVPVTQARQFASALRAATHSPIVYAEMPGAQHAFEVFPSIRTMFVIHGVERFLDVLYAKYLKEQSEVVGTSEPKSHSTSLSEATSLSESPPSESELQSMMQRSQEDEMTGRSNES